jgi:hypothetical protein
VPAARRARGRRRRRLSTPVTGTVTFTVSPDMKIYMKFSILFNIKYCFASATLPMISWIHQVSDRFHAGRCNISQIAVY